MPEMRNFSNKTKIGFISPFKYSIIKIEYFLPFLYLSYIGWYNIEQQTS